ncbi:hypothetical protein E4U43_001665 [Claviceps pusilla]|uniref:DUF202 domain-containing protein n=1 Tax=Claviceps pusilla TaxID=123648 RepID=A0A9P7SVS0_9HYPO|nr:hypothetical protein E4U43_001665 [Claviceps pusilla]
MARDPSRRPSSQTGAGERDEAIPDETTRMLPPGNSAQSNYQALHGAGTTTTRRAKHTSPGGSPGADATPESDEPGRDGQSGAAVVSWLKRTLGNLQSVELENKGSVARDHLALERTFLAWLRTSLAFASIGIAVTQLFRLNTTLSDGSGHGHGHGTSHNATIRRLGKPLGATFLAISILTLLLGTRRYFVGQAWVIRGKFPASRGTVIVVAALALAIMLVSLVVVVVIHPPENEHEL